MNESAQEKSKRLYKELHNLSIHGTIACQKVLDFLKENGVNISNLPEFKADADTPKIIKPSTKPYSFYQTIIKGEGGSSAYFYIDTDGNFYTEDILDVRIQRIIKESSTARKLN